MTPGYDGSRRTVTEGGISRVVEFRADALDRLYPGVIDLHQYEAGQRLRTIWERAQIGNPCAVDLIATGRTPPWETPIEAWEAGRKLCRIERAFGDDRTAYRIVRGVSCGDWQGTPAVRGLEGVRSAFETLLGVMDSLRL